jgi:sigma-B regulation protein RsbU (phosphoserine phosphatase)
MPQLTTSQTVAEWPGPLSGSSAETERDRYRLAICGEEDDNRRLVSAFSGMARGVTARQVAIGDLLAMEAAGRFDLVICNLPADRLPLDRAVESLLDRAPDFALGVVLLTPLRNPPGGVRPCVVQLRPDAGCEAILGAAAAVGQCRPLMVDHEKNISGMQKLHRSLHRHFNMLDRELQLASRLQQDFLPRELPRMGPVRFSTFFRPCTWVSGDIFDVFRLDDDHVGFYLADAIGHGVAAGLLTMYLKHAIRPKRLGSGGDELVPPGEVLAHLSDQLAAQQLPDSQFITGCYGIINARTLRLDYAVAGHPPPMLIEADGLRRELHGEGSLLGLSPGQSFTTESVTLHSGQRMLLYSDGLESVLIAHRPPIPQLPTLCGGMNALIAAPPDELAERLRRMLDNVPGGLSHADDVSYLVLDVA